jgi:hypothetical protein
MGNEGHYILIKRLVLQEVPTIFNVFVPNNRVSKHNAETDRTPRRYKQSYNEVEDFHTLLSVIPTEKNK